MFYVITGIMLVVLIVTSFDLYFGSNDDIRVLRILANRQHYLKLVHTDPKTYKGPIVKEWPPEKDRSLGLYIQGKVRSNCELNQIVTCSFFSTKANLLSKCQLTN